MLISIIIRTLNEQKYLYELLDSIQKQEKDDFSVEVVIIDSGSTDQTLEIAKAFDCKVTFIKKNEFTFGRSLNMGSEFSNGDILVYISGHCIPVNQIWLRELVKPLVKNIAEYSYGRQVGRDTTKFSERELFKKYFPNESKIPQEDFFCNNANSAIKRSVWKKYMFNEEVTGLEDMELSKRCFQDGKNIAYVAEASVYHIHDESWQQTKRRYEREAIALQKIMPEIHISLFDTMRYVLVSILSDFKQALKESCLMKEFYQIIKFRLAQFIGTYIGNHDQRKLSKKQKEDYFYPNNSLKK